MKPVRALAPVLALACLSVAGSPPSALADGAGQGEVPLSPPATVDVVLQPSEIRVGDLVEATIRLEQDATADAPVFPNWQRHWGNAEIREVGDLKRIEGAPGEGRALYSQTLVLTAFRPGTVELPAQPIGVAGDEPIEWVTEPVVFEVGSVLPAEEAEHVPREAESPRPLPWGTPFWWTAGILALLAAGLLTLLLRRRGEDSVFAGKFLDPWEAFQGALARLAEASDGEKVFTGLSLELRRYLGRTLAFPAAESTTTELRRRLLRSGLPSEVCRDVVRLLAEADSVKFARTTPEPGRAAVCLEQVRDAAGAVRRCLQPEERETSSEQAA